MSQFDKPKAMPAIIDRELVDCSACNFTMHRLYHDKRVALFRCRVCKSLMLVVDGRRIYFNESSTVRG